LIVPELGALFFVPTLRVHVLGKDQRLEEREEHRENEMRREDETRKSGTDVRNPSVHIFARRRSWFSYLRSPSTLREEEP
jgi:hypothetical protein